MKLSLATLLIITSFLALVVASWSRAGAESIMMAVILSGLSYIMTMPIVGLMKWQGCSRSSIANVITWSIGLVFTTTLLSFAYALPPEHFVIWTKSGFGLSAIACVAGWLIGYRVSYPCSS